MGLNLKWLNGLTLFVRIVKALGELFEDDDQDGIPNILDNEDGRKSPPQET